MIILATADTHLQIGGMFSRPKSDGLSTRAEVGLSFLEWFLKQPADLHLLAGDLFSQKNAIPVPLYNRVYDLFNHNCPTVLAIPGNHDQYLQSGDVHSLHALQSGSFHVRTQGHDSQGDAEIHSFGAGTPPEKLPPRERAFRILMIHECLVGAAYPTGYISRGGGYDADAILSFMNSNDVDLCICGDIHLGQVMWRSKSKRGKHKTALQKITKLQDGDVFPIGKIILIPGSPYQMDFGDEGNTKGIWEIDTDKRTAKFVEYPDSPLFTTLTDSDLAALSLVDFLPNAFIRFQVTDYVDEARKLVKTNLKGRALVEYKPHDRKETAFASSDVHKHRELVQSYAQQHAPDDRRKQYLSNGLNYYDSAKEVQE